MIAKPGFYVALLALADLTIGLNIHRQRQQETGVELAVSSPIVKKDVQPRHPGGGKRGVAYNDHQLVAPFLNSGNLFWCYNWDSRPNGLQVPSLSLYSAMLWSPIPIHTERWPANAEAALASGVTHLLSFNECDMPSQCNLPPGEAAAAHVKYMNSYAGRAQIGSPSITNSNVPGQSIEWLHGFIGACKDLHCAIDFCTAHWYSPANQVESLFKFLQDVHEACEGKRVWLTEFAPYGSAEEITQFLHAVLPRLDSLPYLERYSYFMASDGLLNSGTGLSALGQTYISA